MTEEHRIVHEVAAVVGLAEGEEGVRDVIRAVARAEPVGVRKVCRATELPVPLVSAICNELCKRGVVSPRRPLRLTRHGRNVFGAIAHRRRLDVACEACAGRGAVLPPSFAAVLRRMDAAAKAAPAPRFELDQVHCTVETKLRRVLAMDEAGALDGRRIVLLGDDDLTSVAIALLAGWHGVGAALRRLVVVDADDRLVSFLRRRLRRAPFPFECLVHDLRDPLPDRLRGAADTVFTDPPYTRAGAELFLSRAAEATGDADRRRVFFAFGPRRPEETLRVQQTIAAMGFTVQRLVRNFNDYVGAGVLGGTSHLYELATTPELRPFVEDRYDGPLYTREVRSQVTASA